MSVIVPIIVTLVLAYLFTFIKLLIKTNNVAKKIPGPPIHPLFGNVPSLFKANTSDLWTIFQGWAREQVAQGNSVMRMVASGTLMVWPLNGKAVAKILDSTTELDKGDDYSFFEQWLGGGLLISKGDERWRSHRKMLTPTFHFAKLEGYFEVFNAESKILIEQIEKFSDSGETVDMFPYVKRCLLDVICGTAMGAKIDAQVNHEHEYLHAVEGFNKLSIMYTFKLWLRNSLIYKILGYRKQTDQYLAVLKGFTEKVIHERRAAIASGEIEKETSKRMMNFLDLLLSQEDSKVLTEQDIREEVDTFMFAGHDTTTSSSSFALWNIAHHSEVQKKIYEELVEVFGEDPRTDVTIESIGKLNYLDRVLKESKRFIAPVPAVLRKLKNDIDIDGHTIPAGSNVLIGPVVIHNNAKTYPEPEKFNPDRFLADEIAKRHPYDFVPFSAGLRNCIGQKFAQLNEKVLICHILRNFEIRPTLEHHETKPCIEVVTKPSRGIPLKLIRR